ncbi:hypothetical protein ACF09C_11730 [Streptomyces sp. NPDC014870]|uniref:hypothetical protein n=1 Tax=Streptomyces sp. NPDC014870 TaxID=3364925 RepID=UPI0036F945B6
MLTPNPASAAVPAAAVVPAVRRPVAAVLRGLIALAAATGVVIECVLGSVAVNAVVLGLAFSALGLAVVALDRVRPAVRGRENRISSQGAGGLK